MIGSLYFYSANIGNTLEKTLPNTENRLPKRILAVDFRDKRLIFIHPLGQDSFTRLAKPPQPFGSGHASNVLEDAEEGTLAGEACLGVSFKDFHVGM